MQGRNESHVFRDLPRSLQIQLALSVFVPMFTPQALFAGIEPGRLNALAICLRSQLYLPGDHIVAEGDVGLDLFFLRSGRVEVSTIRSGLVILATMEMSSRLDLGCMFGEIAFFLPVRRIATVCAVSCVELMVLNQTDWRGNVSTEQQSSSVAYAERMREVYQKVRCSLPSFCNHH